MNISSIVVQTRPEFLEEVIKDIKKSDVCDYHLNDKLGRIIITIEGKCVSEELEKLKVIENIAHVVSADMQMAYSEDELYEHITVLKNSNAVPSMLNKDLAPEEILYNGDLKHKNLIGFAEQFDRIEN